ncbi:aspartate/glutamate racemase family protein [Sphaerochaeta sp. PS]|uniref:aspartate/glutamate racemase family protein n=1 Tax=Sphaerochaeta sp. PS TaxID=3076336 RepID=UPI0028A4F0F3|nr:aspartate/glutamate racemase family protein [Sphaerochaeta sp. PS]MDT4762999.1 aspartate/glutamate racemase family protein [Sphaerochaeta sp. PS]
MKKVAIIYTVRPVLATFPELLEEVVGEPLKIFNLLDDFLASDPGETGSFSIDNKNRLFNDLKSCELTGADVIVVTCSTLTPIVQLIRPFIKVPIVAIDDAMTAKAVRIGSRIKVVATAASTLKPTEAKLQQEARLAGVEIHIDSEDNEVAYAAMKRGDLATHDRLVLSRIAEVKGYDSIVLAQASMAHLEAEAESLANVPVLSSPRLCCAQVKQILSEIHR